jgi:hypothetical protein
MQAHLLLFIARELQGSLHVRHGDRHQSPIVSVRSVDPWTPPAKLIPNVEVHREAFVMVRTGNVAVWGAEADAADLGTKQTGTNVTRREEPAEPMKGVQGRPHQTAINL